MIFFCNQRVEPSADYTYDALYRLVSATGREHLGQTGSAINPPQQVTNDDSSGSAFPSPATAKPWAPIPRPTPMTRLATSWPWHTR